MHIFDEDEPIEKRFEDLCQALCIEGNVREEAWDKYKDVWTNFSIDGDQLQWLVCSLYECCRRSNSDSISGQSIDNVYVSLSRLLTTAKMSMVQSFHRIRKWADMTDMVDDMRDRIEHLERQFAISSVAFRHYNRAFSVIFVHPSDDTFTTPVGHLNATELFRFVWIMFIKTRANFPAVSDDLVNSFYLLACCFDWMLGMLLMAGERDLLNLDYRGLPKDFGFAESIKSWRPDFESQPCLLRVICEDNDINYVECKAVKEHFFRPYITRLIEKDLMKLRPPGCIGLFNRDNFGLTLQNLNNHYEEYIIGTGDFDERIYLSPNAVEEIGSTGERVNQSTDAGIMSVPLHSNHQEGGPFVDYFGGGPLTSSRTKGQNLIHIQALLSGRHPFPSVELVEFVNKHCSLETPVEDIAARISNMNVLFSSAYSNPLHVVDENQIPQMTGHITHLGQTLYYHVLENVLMEEFNRLEKRHQRLNNDKQSTILGGQFKPDLCHLINCEALHRGLYALCLEIIMFCSNSDHHFPWILEAIQLDILSFFKMIEIVVRNSELPRNIVKYLNQLVELILNTHAWAGNSSIWPIIKSGSRAPAIDEIFPAKKLDDNCSEGRFGRQELLVTPMGNTSVLNSSSNSRPHGSFLSSSLKMKTSPSKQIRLSSNQRVIDNKDLPSRLCGSVHESNEDESARAAAQLLATDELELLPELRNDVTDLESITEDSLRIIPIQSSGGEGRWLCDVYPVRHDSIAIFFRNVYQLSVSRLRTISDRLVLTADTIAKIWTCFEHVIVNDLDLLKDRCLDQIILCCIYGICKVVVSRPLTFVEIVQAYRMQPQCTRDVYRRVLLGFIQVGEGNRLVEERGDLSRFYNLTFLPRTCRFLQQFDIRPLSANGGNLRISQPPISAMPAMCVIPSRPIKNSNLLLQNDTFQPSRRLTNNRNVFITATSQQVNLSTKRVTYTVGRSSSKDLIEMNTVIGAAERRASMTNLAMGLKRPSGLGPGVTIATGGSPFTISSSGDRQEIQSRGVTFVSPSGYETKRIDFNI